VDGQPSEPTRYVPQTAVKLAKPSGTLVNPARAFVQHLKEALPLERILAYDVAAQNFRLFWCDGDGGHPPGNVGVCVDFDHVQPCGLVSGLAGMGVLDTVQTGHLHQPVAAGLCSACSRISSFMPVVFMALSLLDK